MAGSYTYLAPETEAELLHCVAGGEAPVRILSGGTWLVPLLQTGELEAATVVDLRFMGLDGIELAGDTLRIGTAMTYADLAANEAVARGAPLLLEMAAGITGGPQIRHQGTIGGSAAYANPASDVPTVLVALDAQLVVASQERGRRSIPAGAFFVGAFRTALEPDEVLVAIEVDAGASRRVGSYRKLKFGEGSWPVVTAGALVAGDTLVVAVGGLADRPVRVEFSASDPPDHGGVADALRATVPASDAWADELADAAYRGAVAPVVAWRAIDAVLQGPQ